MLSGKEVKHIHKENVLAQNRGTQTSHSRGEILIFLHGYEIKNLGGAWGRG